MSSSVPSLVTIPAMPDDAGPNNINPTTLSKIGTLSYNQQENGYGLEWESRANFNDWLTHEQAA
ncbi:hypothetical protein V8E52_006518 [Russula decolorans]|jgi:hypothetical protein